MVVVTSLRVLVARRVECNIVGCARLGIFAPKYDKINIDKNEAFKRYPTKISQNIDNINDYIGCIILIDGSYYFNRCFSCVLCVVMSAKTLDGQN